MDVYISKILVSKLSPSELLSPAAQFCVRNLPQVPFCEIHTLRTKCAAGKWGFDEQPVLFTTWINCVSLILARVSHKFYETLASSGLFPERVRGSFRGCYRDRRVCVCAYLEPTRTFTALDFLFGDPE